MNAKPIIAWQNRVLSADLTVSSEAAGFPKENLPDWRPYLAWKGVGLDEQWLQLDAGPGRTLTADCVGISGHDFQSQNASLELAASENGSDWEVIVPAFVPSDNRSWLKTFAAVSRRWWRLRIPVGYSSPPRLGIWFLGEHLSFPVYPELGFDPDGQVKESEVQQSRGGNLLGVVERFSRREVRVNFRHLSPAWCEAVWKPFFAAHGLKPFFWAWDLQNHRDQVYLMRLLKPQLAMPYEGGTWRALELTLEGLLE